MIGMAGEPQLPVSGGAGGPDRAGTAWGEIVLRVLGALVAVAGALVTALIEAFLSPLRVDTVRVPVSVVVAVVANVALVWFTYRVTGSRAAVALPALVWLAVMFGFAGWRTTEGDQLLRPDNWVGQLTIFGGAVAFGLGAYRLILPRQVDRSEGG